MESQKASSFLTITIQIPVVGSDAFQTPYSMRLHRAVSSSVLGVLVLYTVYNALDLALAPISQYYSPNRHLCPRNRSVSHTLSHQLSFSHITLKCFFYICQDAHFLRHNLGLLHPFYYLKNKYAEFIEACCASKSDHSLWCHCRHHVVKGSNLA